MVVAAKQAEAMLVLAHRGLWYDRADRNTPAALERALRAGYGVETDVRDCLGRLVISHDMPSGREQLFDDFLDTYVSLGSTAPLAINIKADGLAAALRQSIETRGIVNAFCFDMSVPDTRSYAAAGLRFFARRSELEPPTPLVEQAAGIWLDAFTGTWFDAAEIRRIRETGLDVCVVSPELHGRPHEPLWALLHDCPQGGGGGWGRLMICTDLPERFVGGSA